MLHTILGFINAIGWATSAFIIAGVVLFLKFGRIKRGPREYCGAVDDDGDVQ